MNDPMSQLPDDWASVPTPEPAERVAAGPQTRAANAAAPTGLEATPAPILSADGRPIGRPAPQYGEYAPEGWVNPALQQERDAVAERRELAAREAAAVRESRPVPPVRPSAPAERDAPQEGGAPAVSRPGFSPLDLLATCVLLAIGLYTVVSQMIEPSAYAATIASTVERQYVALSKPGALVPIAAWCAVGQGALFVLTAWWSISRLRHRKLTFWIPLVAGVVATLATGIAFTVTVFHDPAFLAWWATHSGNV
jgi:hypothetical protein